MRIIRLIYTQRKPTAEREWVREYSLSILILTVLLAATGCNRRSNANEVPVYPITGRISVNGSPVTLIRIEMHNISELAPSQFTFPQGFTDDDGEVRISTYSDGDGAPEGRYRVTLALQDYNVLTRTYEGPNQLGDNYADPKNSPISIDVGPGLPNTIGNIDIKTEKSP